MYRIIGLIGLTTAVVLICGHDSQAQRRGGGAVRGGGVIGPGGGAAVGTRTTSSVVGPYGGGASTRATGQVIGPGGGSATVKSGSGSHTTAGGTTINYGGVGAKGTTPGGVNVGRGVGGVQVTTPGGNTVTKVGKAGGAVGPGGNAVGGRSGVTVGTGPGGSFGTAYKGGVAIGPHGGVAGGTKVGVATGPGGTVGGVSRSGIATGPYGTVAGGSRVVAGQTIHGTRYVARSTLVTTGGVVRRSITHYPAFTPTWIARYPGAWFAAGWTAARFWTMPVWGTVAVYGGYPAEPVYYDYGSTVVYQGDAVYVDGDRVATAEEYAQQATQLADAGRAAKLPADGEFQPLGVFALVQGEETNSSNIFQLAIDKQGVIRGNYYNALTDTTEPIYGSVDPKTQRAAWTVADRKNPVYEAGIANLTQDETTILVHFGKDNAQQFTLVRIPQPEDGAAPEGK